jgi:hypothetical protein
VFVVLNGIPGYTLKQIKVVIIFLHSLRANFRSGHKKARDEEVAGGFFAFNARSSHFPVLVVRHALVKHMT